MFFDLPKEIQEKIFELEPTKREKMDWVIHQINIIPVLEQLKEKKFQAGTVFPWWRDYFCRRNRRPTKLEIQNYRKLYWKNYWEVLRWGGWR